MVHVMSEVKNPILGYADSYRTMARNSPANRQQVSIWSVVADLERNMAPLWDAQRLRADTAEAERDDLKKHQGILLRGAKYARSRRDYWLKRGDRLQNELAAAEQRIASLEKLLRRIAKHYERSNVRETHRAIDEIEAALNPNPEAESHEL